MPGCVTHTIIEQLVGHELVDFRGRCLCFSWYLKLESKPNRLAAPIVLVIVTVITSQPWIHRMSRGKPVQSEV